MNNVLSRNKFITLIVMFSSSKFLLLNPKCLALCREEINPPVELPLAYLRAALMPP